MLPSSRNRTYTGANSIVPGDLDDLQDCIIGAKHGNKTLHINGAFGHGSATPFEGFARLANASGTWIVQIPVHYGDRIKSVTIAARGNAASDVSPQLKKFDAAGVDALLETIAMTNIPAAWTDFVITVDPMQVVLAGEHFYLIFPATSGANIDIGCLRVVYDRP